LGWDSIDRSYFVLDDNRLYRRTDEPLPPSRDPSPKPKKSKAKPKARGSRASKRRKVSRVDTSDDEAEDMPVVEQGPSLKVDNDGFGAMTWEIVAISLEEYQVFIDTIRKSKDANERQLIKRLNSQVIPIIEKQAEEKRAKETRRLREMQNIQKLATAKRSSRIAGKMEKQREVEEAEEADRKRFADLAMARKEQERQAKQEEDRESRMMTREQRIKEREAKRILQEEELRRLEEDQQKAEANEGRLSERHIKTEMAKRKAELDELNQKSDDWWFDCSVCGLHGKNLVCLLDVGWSDPANCKHRMTVLTVYNVKTVSTGNTLYATAWGRRKQKMITSTSCVKHAGGRS